MNVDDHDEFDRALAALRGDEPPHERATLREDVLAAFDRGQVACRAAPRRIVWIGLAAAAVVFVATQLGRRAALAPDSGNADVEATTHARAPRTLWSDLDALARRIERLPPAAPPTLPVYDAPEADPNFSRLVVARAYERIDLDRARERYRELAMTDAGGTVRDAAALRLEQLGR